MPVTFSAIAAMDNCGSRRHRHGSCHHAVAGDRSAILPDELATTDSVKDMVPKEAGFPVQQSWPPSVPPETGERDSGLNIVIVSER